MSRRPGIALKVNDLATSLAFFITSIGCTHVDEQNDPDTALILDEDGDAVLLSSLDTTETKKHLDEPRIVFKPGDTLTFPDSDIDARYALLAGVDTINQSLWYGWTPRLISSSASTGCLSQKEYHQVP